MAVPHDGPRTQPCMLDTNALSELVRNPHGTLAQALASWGVSWTARGTWKPR